MTLTRTTLVATGRFQRVHLGSLSYLVRAYQMAQQLGSDFIILTGPQDEELLVHGLRVGRSENRRLLSFRERQVLLSVLLSLPQVAILNNKSSPHHGEPGLTIWVNEFFSPLNDAVVKMGEGSQVTGAGIYLAIIRKSSDHRVYRKSDKPKHYVDYLMERYPDLKVIELGASVNDTHLNEELSSSALLQTTDTGASALPAVMLAAEFLIALGISLTGNQALSALTSVKLAYAQAIGEPDEVRRLVVGSLELGS
jgi:hypothetical protein